jgi:hypothetical protein
MSNISKPQERKEHKELSSVPVVNASAETITVPMLKFKLDAKTQALLEENFVLQGNGKDLLVLKEVVRKVEEKVNGEKVIKFVRGLGNAKIINYKKKEMTEEFYGQLIAAMTDLKKTLDGSATNKATPDSLRKLLEGRPEAREKERGLDECAVCLESFSTKSPGHEYYPYMNSAGYSFTRDCSEKPENTEKDPINRDKLVPMPYGNKESRYIPNNDVASFIKNKPIFIDKFIAVAALLLSDKAQPVADEKSSHTTTTSSSSSAQATAIPDPKDLDPEMMAFLLEMGISYKYLPVNICLDVFEKLSPLTQRRFFTEPREDNSLLVYQICAGKFSKKFSKNLFNVAEKYVNAPDKEGRVALMQAIAMGDISGAEVLLSLGAKVDAVNNAGGTVLHELVLRGEVASEKRLPFLRKLKERLELDEVKKSQQEPQIDKWRSFVNLPNKAGATSLLLAVARKNTDFVKDLLSLAIMCKDARFAKDLLSFEETFPLVFELIENFNADKTYTEQVEILKQDALELAATRANEFAENSEDFARYKGYMESLIRESARISQDFVNKLPEGGVKDSLQARLDMRSKRRGKNKDKNKKKKEGSVSSKEPTIDDSEGLAVEDSKCSAPAKIEVSANYENAPPPEKILTEQSQHCLDELKKFPSDEGGGYIEKLIAHWKSWGAVCMAHAAQLVRNEKYLEVSDFIAAFKKIVVEWSRIVPNLSTKGYPEDQLLLLLAVISSKKDDLTRLSERHREAMDKSEAKAPSSQPQSSSSTVSTDISAETFRPMLEKLKSPFSPKLLMGNPDLFERNRQVVVDVFRGVGKVCRDWAINDKSVYSCLRQAKALNAAIDAIDELYKKNDLTGREVCLRLFGRGFLELISSEKAQIREAAVDVFVGRFKDEVVKADFKSWAETTINSSLNQDNISSSSSSREPIVDDGEDSLYASYFDDPADTLAAPGDLNPERQSLTESSQLCLKMLWQVPSLLGVAPLEGVLKHFEAEGDPCRRYLTHLLESKQKDEAVNFSLAAVTMLQEKQSKLVAELKKMGYSKEQLKPLNLILSKKIVEVDTLMERFMPSITPQKMPVPDQAGRGSVWKSSAPFLSPASSFSSAESKNVSKKQMSDSAYQPIKGLTLEGLRFLKNNAQNMFDSANGLVADFQTGTESEKETAICFAINALRNCLSEINKVRFQANHIVLPAADKTNFLKELDQLEMNVNAAKAALEPSPTHKNTLG